MNLGCGANLLCVAPILTDDPRRESEGATGLLGVLLSLVGEAWRRRSRYAWRCNVQRLNGKCDV